MNPNDAQRFDTVLGDELQEIRESRKLRERSASQPSPDQAEIYTKARDAGLVGLAFSGGGIRSATLNLGIVQGLAERELLRAVDYLSTVSGGGYIGSWLTGWIQERGKGSTAAKAVADVEKFLSPAASPDPNLDELRPISFLRDYSNYLTPQLGMFSADTWTSLMIWFRNTFLNLIILISAACAVLLLPRFVGRITLWFEDSGPLLAVSAGAILLVVAFLIGRNIRDLQKFAEWKKQHAVVMGIVLPVLVACWAAAGALWSLVLTERGQASGPEFPWSHFFTPGLLTAGVIFLLLLILEFLGKLKTSVAWFPLFAAGAAATCGGLTMLIGRLFWQWVDLDDEGYWHLTAWGAPLFLQALTLTLTIHMGLMGRFFPDERREWLARLGAWLLIASLACNALFCVAIYGPLLVAKLLGWGKMWLAGAGAGWLGTTISGLLFGHSSQSGGPAQNNAAGESRSAAGGGLMKVIAALAPYVFIAGLLLGLATILHAGLSSSADIVVVNYWQLLRATPTGLLLEVFAASLIVALVFSYTVDINEFSMNHFYRNRLVRAYLGASRDGIGRTPNPFTGFDPEDERELATYLHSSKEPYAGPYPIINTTLNLTHGERLSWQERKAESFIFTPQYTGFHRRDKPSFRPTKKYACPTGIPVGMAVAISGAAANPNQGFHSSAALAFLMTVFNVRLGMWVGNPLHDKWTSPSPALGLNYLFADLFGLSNDKRSYVSLSDGGHFENLGIYELVRRRCALIIACDAEQDAEQHFQGLGSAIRKCRTDFGVEIDLEIAPLRRLDSTRRSSAHCAVGTIYYPERDQYDRPLTGTLFYVKSSLTGDEPEDVLEYESYEPAFPHQSTADQFFDESQFESYRRLGYHIAQRNFHLLERIIELVEEARSTPPGADYDSLTDKLDSLREAIRAPAG